MHHAVLAPHTNTYPDNYIEMLYKINEVQIKLVWLPLTTAGPPHFRLDFKVAQYGTELFQKKKNMLFKRNFDRS